MHSQHVYKQPYQNQCPNLSSSNTLRKVKLWPWRRMATPQQQEEDSEDDLDLLKILLPDNENGFSKLQHDTLAQEVQQHYIHSIKSMVIIRQLPSQGLSTFSFQLWLVATTLFTLLDNHSTSLLSPILDTTSNGSHPGFTRPTPKWVFTSIWTGPRPGSARSRVDPPGRSGF